MTTRDIAGFLRSVDDAGCKPRTVNRYRQLISAAFNYAMREDAYGLAANPAAATTKRREPPPAVLDFYEPDEVELLARAAERGAHRTPGTAAISEDEQAARRLEDRQDAELYQIAAYTGLRLGELLALRWQDVNLVDRRLVVHRAFSAGVEGPTKSWQARFIPVSDGAARAFADLLDRDEFTSATDFVFCNRLGRPLNGAVLRRRFKRTAATAGLRVLRFHSLRHGAGSLVARQADPGGFRASSATPSSPRRSATLTLRRGPRMSTVSTAPSPLAPAPRHRNLLLSRHLSVDVRRCPRASSGSHADGSNRLC